MPYQIAGQPGTWYEPGTRKGNTKIVWRGQLPNGIWTEITTDSTTQSGAEKHRRRLFERWHRDNPPATADQTVTLESAAHHYKRHAKPSKEDETRIDRIVRLIGPGVPVRDINQTHLTKASDDWLLERRIERQKALKDERRAYPPPTTETVNREVTTPLRGIVNFATNQQWRAKIVIEAVKAPDGEVLRPPPPKAEDSDIAAVLKALDRGIKACTEMGRRHPLNARRRRQALVALKALVWLVHERGYRIGEWLSWRWEHIELKKARAKILLSKPDRWAEFALSREAVTVLSAMGAREAGYVFPWRWRSGVYDIVDSVKARDADGRPIMWRPHQSRRAVVTSIIRQTKDPKLAQKYVGHKSLKTTLRYDIIEPEDILPRPQIIGDSRGKRR